MKKGLVFFLFMLMVYCVWLSASAETTMVEYVDANGVSQDAVEAIVVESSTEAVTWNTGWYAVEGSIQIDTRIKIAGDVNLILADDAIFGVQGGIHVAGSDTLTIWGQNAGSGKLTIDGANISFNYAGIGGNQNEVNGPITINGGTIQVSGSDYGGAGIGGGSYANGINITINGGTVTATGGNHIEGSAGIGGGRNGDGSNITINGGTVIANGSGSRYGGAGIGGGSGGNGINITINGGTVQAKGRLAYSPGAGIGGGSGGHGNEITITGGTVTANGIGGGNGCDGNNITITGGAIETTGTYVKDISSSQYYSNAGIGGGYNGDGNNITITGGTVTATGGHSGGQPSTYFNSGASGIGGGGNGNGKNINISGGTVIAIGGSSNRSGAGIGGGGSGSGSGITISGGMVTASGPQIGIGGGVDGSTSNITFSGGMITVNGSKQAIGVVPTFDSYDHLTFGNAEATTETDTPVEWTGYPNEEWSWRWVKIQPATITLIFDPTNPTVVLDGISSSTLNFTVEYSAILPDGANALLPEAAPTWSVRGNQSSGTTITSGKLTVAADERAATLTVTASLNGTTYTTQVTVQQPTYTVTFDSGVSAQTVSRYKQAIEPTPPSRAGYIFAGWYNNGVLYDFSREVIGNLTLIARWTEDPASSEDITPPSVAPDATHVITLDPNGGSCHLSSLATTSDGTLPPLPTAARKGYTFDGWFTKREGGERVMSTTVFTSDTTVYAHWIEIPKTGDETPLALWALLIVLALGGMLFSLQRPIKHR